MSMVVFMVAGAGVAFALAHRAKALDEWAAAFNDAAAKLGGRVSGGVSINALSLRAEIDGVTVTIEVHGLPKTATMVADVVLPADAPMARLYVGIGVRAAPADLAHIPDAHGASYLSVPGAAIKCDMPGLAEAFMISRSVDIIALQRDLAAGSLEILYRSGRAYVTARKTKPRGDAVVALARAVVGLRSFDASQRHEPADDATTTAPSPRAGPFGPKCALCTGEALSADPWLLCVRCDSIYHARCWQVATGCVAPDCTETRAMPV